MRSLARPGAPSVQRPLDLAGTVAAVSGLVLLLAALSGIGNGGSSPAAWLALIGAVVVLAAFGLIEARARWPLLPRGLERDRPLIAGTLASAVNTAATSPFAVLGAIYLQDVRGWSPAANGLSFVPFSVMVIVGSGVGAAVLGRLGPARTLGAATVMLTAMPLVSCAVSADGGEGVAPRRTSARRPRSRPRGGDRHGARPHATRTAASRRGSSTPPPSSGPR